MKTIQNIIAGSKTNISLQKLVDDIILKASGQISGHKIIMRNNVPAGLYINANEDVVGLVIDGMLKSMIANGADGDIDISGRELFSNTIKVSVKDNNCYNTYAVACNLQSLVPLTEKIGGYLNITNQRQKITTIEFSFPVIKDEEHTQRDDD